MVGPRRVMSRTRSSGSRSGRTCSSRSPALPVLVTVAVGLVERSAGSPVGDRGVRGARASRSRRRSRSRCSGVRSAPSIEGRHIAYQVDALGHGGRLTALYVVATCGALLASSYRDLEILGALNLVAVPVLAWLTLSGFVSLWCFWAAMVSVVIALHLARV